jgi:hypothetical protein
MINQPETRDRSKLGATTTDTPGLRLDVPGGKAKAKKPTPAAKKKKASSK